MITASKLYKKHLKLCTPDGYQSEKQMQMYRNDAAINAIQEALDMLNLTESHVELLENGGFSD
tara:strand:+ start:5244 stop:5432 length:189 start_codon:yes stop_codon:yes gene_type:complete